MENIKAGDMVITGLIGSIIGLGMGLFIGTDPAILGGDVVEEEKPAEEIVEEVKPEEKPVEQIVSFETKDSTILATKENIIKAVQEDPVFEDKVAEVFVDEKGDLNGQRVLEDREIFNALIEVKFSELDGPLVIEDGDFNKAILNLLKQ